MERLTVMESDDGFWLGLSEFMPYVFQIFALTLDFNPAGISEAYMQLFPFLLSPILWEKQGNIHPLVRLLRSYVAKGSSQIVETGKLVRFFSCEL